MIASVSDYIAYIASHSISCLSADWRVVKGNPSRKKPLLLVQYIARMEANQRSSCL